MFAAFVEAKLIACELTGRLRIEALEIEFHFNKREFLNELVESFDLNCIG